ncbi:MAG: hypothetical protein AAGA96_07255 [Verrucomicrobiota bacterium]
MKLAISLLSVAFGIMILTGCTTTSGSAPTGVAAGSDDVSTGEPANQELQYYGPAQ